VTLHLRTSVSDAAHRLARPLVRAGHRHQSELTRGVEPSLLLLLDARDPRSRHLLDLGVVDTDGDPAPPGCVDQLAARRMLSGPLHVDGGSPRVRPVAVDGRAAGADSTAMPAARNPRFAPATRATAPLGSRGMRHIYPTFYSEIALGSRDRRPHRRTRSDRRSSPSCEAAAGGPAARVTLAASPVSPGSHPSTLVERFGSKRGAAASPRACCERGCRSPCFDSPSLMRPRTGDLSSLSFGLVRGFSSGLCTRPARAHQPRRASCLTSPSQTSRAAATPCGRAARARRFGCSLGGGVSQRESWAWAPISSDSHEPCTSPTRAPSRWASRVGDARRHAARRA